MAFVRTVKTISSTGETHEYLRIVENYWDKKKKKKRQRVVATLGNLSILRKDIKQIVNGLLKAAGEKPYVFAGDLRNQANKEYGIRYITEELWRWLGLNNVVENFLKCKKVELNYGKLIKMMVVNKLSDPASKLGMLEWLKTVWYPDHEFDERVLAEDMEDKKHQAICKKEVMKLYRSLDYLSEMKPEIERHLYLTVRDLLSLNVDMVFYDLTSSYFEGGGPEGLGAKGYSRDHEPGKEQIVIGIIMCNGLPIGFEVFEGNRVDKKTVTQVLDKLKKEFKINKCVFVGDRGLVSATNIEELEDHGFEYILALKKRRNNKVKSILSKSEGQEWVSINKELKYREVEMDETLYIICYNPEIGKEQKAGREANLKKLENELHRLAVKVNSMKRPAIKTIVRQVEDILSHKHGRRLLNYKVDEKTRELSYWRKKEAIELEEKIDGVWFLCTKEKSLKAREIIYAYKDLADVERAFRTMKSSLDLRPYFHRTRERVNAHTFICVLAYFLEKVIENALKKQGIKISGQKAIQSLRQIGVAVIKVEDEYYGYVTEVTYRQKQVLDSLNLKLPSRIITHKN